MPKPIDRICVVCAAVFHGHKGRKYCSARCRKTIHRQPWNTGKYIPRPEKRKGQIRECVICQKEFYAPACRPKANCCSPECYFKKRWPDNRELRHCIICGEPFEVSKSDERKCCSPECTSAHLSEIRHGDKSPLWKGGYDRYYGSNWFRQRRMARKRDNFHCQLCWISEQELGRKLDVHHIARIGSFSIKEDANQLDNLVCYCHPCHMFVETITGQR